MTTQKTIAATLAGAPLALDLDLGRALLSVPVPTAEVPIDPVVARGAGAVLEVPRGERFAVARGVAVVPVRGVLTPNAALYEKYLGWATYFGLADTCAALAEDPAVGAICFEFDTPGGYVMGCETAAQAIAALTKVKPTFALAAPMAASAGYWLASQCGEISVVPGGAVGSIGVAMSGFQHVAPNGSGEQWARLLSSHARAKVPDPTTDEGRALIAQDLDALEARFHDAVAAGRGIAVGELAARLSVTDAPEDGGAVYVPEDAVARGVADHVETRGAFYQRIFDAYASKPKSGGRSAMIAKAAAASAAAARAVSEV